MVVVATAGRCLRSPIYCYSPYLPKPRVPAPEILPLLRKRRAARAAARGPPRPWWAHTRQKGDIGVYFTGLGAVTPIYTVTVKSRVDGELMEVHFREGDIVHKGDLLMEIDPRPYQVQLTQAEGQMARDQAALENARIDLARYERC